VKIKLPRKIPRQISHGITSGYRLGHADGFNECLRLVIKFNKITKKETK